MLRSSLAVAVEVEDERFTQNVGSRPAPGRQCHRDGGQTRRRKQLKKDPGWYRICHTKEATLLLSNALPEEGRRMTKGSGRSACFRGGVTYGYRECLRKGRIRQKLRRKFADHSWSTNLRRASSAQSVVLERSARLLRAISANPSQNHFAVFLW